MIARLGLPMIAVLLVSSVCSAADCSTIVSRLSDHRTALQNELMTAQSVIQQDASNFTDLMTWENANIGNQLEGIFDATPSITQDQSVTSDISTMIMASNSQWNALLAELVECVKH